MFAMNLVHLAVLVLLSALFGCSDRPQAPGPRPLDDRERLAWYDRTNVAFERGVLYAPGDGLPPDDPGRTFAPLIILQIADTGAADLPAAPDVYHHAGEVMLRGRAHASRTYLWRQGGGNNSRALRMTLGDDGYPLVYEILGHPSGGLLLFVASNVEEAAVAEFGPPLPGRQFSVERDTGETPGVIVGGLVEPGATPMGPFVYLWSDGEVDTVICRCMPSMVDRIDDTVPYALAPTPAADVEGLRPERLDRLLRLPQGLF